MVKKFTLLELHLDDAKFSNAVANTPEAADELLDEIETADEMETTDETEMADEMPIDESSGRSFGRTLRMAALGIVVAVGIRTIARRFLADDETAVDSDATTDDEYDEESVTVDVEDSIEA